MQKSFNADIEQSTKHDFYIKLKHKKRLLTLRVIKLQLPSGEEETLITNLSRNHFKKDSFQSLYFLRWKVETRYNTLKNKLQIEDFSGKTCVSILQDFYVTMYLLNMATAIKSDAEEAIRAEDDSKELKHTYEVNEGMAIGKLKNKLILILMNDDPDQQRIMLDKLVERIRSFKVAVVPDRHFKRPTEAHKKTRSRIKRVL